MTWTSAKISANRLWRKIVAISISIFVLLIYIFVFRVDLSRIATVGLQVLLLAGLASLARLFVLGARFYVIVRDLNGKVGADLSGSVAIRMASEFIALITPTYVGGEALRVAWLTKRGMKLGRAIWAAYLEVLYDVIAGSAISIVAATYAALKGSYLLAFMILIIALPILGFYVLITWLSVRRRLKLPNFVSSFLERIVGAKRAEGVKEKTTKILHSYSEAATRFLGSSSPGAVLKLSTLTFLAAIITGVPLWIIFEAFGVEIGLFLATLSSYASITIGSVPVTPGGSGLSELGLSLYALEVFGISAWEAVVAWRLISYHLPLMACGVSMLVTTYRKL